MKPVRERGQALQSNVPMASVSVAIARLFVHESARLAKGFVLLANGPACVFGGLLNVPMASVSVAVARLLVYEGA